MNRYGNDCDDSLEYAYNTFKTWLEQFNNITSI